MNWCMCASAFNSDIQSLVNPKPGACEVILLAQAIRVGKMMLFGCDKCLLGLTFHMIAG